MIKIDDVLTKKKKSKSKKKEIQNCTLGQILLDALELLENQVTDGSCIMKLFVERFFLSNFESENFNDFRRNCLEDYSVIKINSKFTETLQIPLGQRTLKELKEITSWYFGITPNDLHFVGYETESITDSEEITLTKNMTLHFIYILKMDGTVLESIGKGSFGEIFKYKLSDKLYAVKSIKDSQSLERDINIQSDLKFCKELVTFDDLYRYEGNVAFRMPYFENESLYHYIETHGTTKKKESFLPEEIIFQICFDILTQMHKIHKMMIVHRDIKTENVVLDANLNAKLIDFGWAKSINNVTEDKLKRKLISYAPGTRDCMAPELWKQEAYSTKLDIWSFGIMVKEMITGKRINIYSAENKKEFRLPENCSSEIKEFVKLCLVDSPADRWSAKQLLTSNFMKKF